MKLSVLIPMYNASKYIGNCLDSLINQDIPKEDYEIIVIDDGSTDDSARLVNKYVDSNKNIFLHSQDNIGLFETRNKLLKLAKGEYIYNLDADDYICYNSIGAILRIAIFNKADILGFNSISTTNLDLFNSNTRLINKKDEVYSGIEFLSDIELHNITVWWYIVNREFIIENNISFEKGNPMEDGPFTLRTFFKAKRIVFLDFDVHRYVQVPTSIMNNTDESHLRKMISNYVDIAYRYNTLITNISKSKDIKLDKIIYKIKYWRDANTFVMFNKFIQAKISIWEINKILKEFRSINVYPLSNIIGVKSNHYKLKLGVLIFNNKFLFYILLFPLRLLYKFKLIKLL